ncbi:MAG TPA: DUF2267 domain-containing protein [Methylocella sp.]|nr:DUF2267 domain-containing protein [Methylocella sp.]
MEDLIADIATETGVDPAAARQALGLILAFLRQEGPKTEVDALFAGLPGAEEAAAATADGGEAGGGLMGLASKLSDLGFGMGEMQAAGRQIFAYARARTGDEAVGQIVAAIPGLAQFL